MAIVASAVAAAATGQAHPSDNMVLVPPADLPALARQPGEAMLLHDTLDGRRLLHIEQNPGARSATFDVSDPVHIKGEGSVKLEMSGPFDFISPLGNQAELVRFRQGRDAVLELPGMKELRLKTVHGLTLQGLDVPAPRYYQVVDTVSSYELNRVFDVKRLRAEMKKRDTGTAVILTDNGLYVIRRPAVESIHQLMLIPTN
jgi:hypothetical protein